MSSYQVTCIVKSNDQFHLRERITNLGIQTSSGTQVFPETQIIAWIESGANSFYVMKAGKPVKVIVAVRQGRKYLKTVADGVEPNNLLALPRCWR